MIISKEGLLSVIFLSAFTRNYSEKTNFFWQFSCIQLVMTQSIVFAFFEVYSVFSVYYFDCVFLHLKYVQMSSIVIKGRQKSDLLRLNCANTAFEIFIETSFWFRVNFHTKCHTHVPWTYSNPVLLNLI